MIPKLGLQYLDEGIDHQHEEELTKGVTLDDAVCQADLTDFLAPKSADQSTNLIELSV